MARIWRRKPDFTTITRCTTRNSIVAANATKWRVRAELMAAEHRQQERKGGGEMAGDIVTPVSTVSGSVTNTIAA